MVMPQYPYQLFVKTTEGGYQNDQGHIIPGTDSWINVSVCRDETENGTKHDLNDGSFYDYSSIIYMPKNCPKLNNGDTIEVRNGAEVRLKGTVKLFSEGFFNCRIWS